MFRKIDIGHIQLFSPIKSEFSHEGTVFGCTNKIANYTLRNIAEYCIHSVRLYETGLII